MARPIRDMTDQRHGLLTVLSRVGSAAYGGTTWNCRCDCGVECVVVGRFMRDGTTTSCGCVRRARMRSIQPLGVEQRTSHGMTSTATYQSWSSMRARCLNPKNSAWENYGGRGITICVQWDSFAVFLADMGQRPEGDWSLDRINNGGNYEPDNCRWADRKTQLHNRRTVPELQEELDMWKSRALMAESIMDGAR